MRIITVPNPVLRQSTQAISQVDKKLEQLVKELGTTLQNTRNPRGVGLAAPQINTAKQAFATYLPPASSRPTKPDENNDDGDDSIIQVYINPQITGHTGKLTLGPDPENPTLEGCLSIPGLYGPVPRWPEIELSFLELVDGQLKPQTRQFTDFAARVVQHEFDHLQGILFIDYSLEYDLPVYQENKQSGKLEEIDHALLQGL